MSHPLLTAPIGRSLLRLAGPTTGLMALQILIGFIDTWLIGRLGTEALAGAALVFPVQMLMQNIAAGGMGGGVASTMARTLGAGRQEDARALVLHALLLGLAFALAFTALAWTLLPLLYRELGGSAGALQRAIAYNNVWFGGAAFVWINFFLAALLRGSGDAMTPSRNGLIASLAYAPIAALLSLGMGSWPGLGLTGLAVAAIAANAGATMMNVRAVWQGRLGFRPTLFGLRFTPGLLHEILGVGLMGSLTTITANVTILLVTGLVGHFGTAAIAGYGIVVRLEFMVAPIAFGVGVGTATLVGIAAGAGNWRRAMNAAWTGALVAFAIGGTMGWTAALLPESWAGLFTTERDVMDVAVTCLTRVAPFYCLFALGLSLNFASQGAARMVLPVSAGIVRLLVAWGGGWFALQTLGGGLAGIFTALAASFAIYGGSIAAVLLAAPWRSRR